ncbi:MAG TPA: metallophosphoesterase [Stellaceae bacterium]|nr:metallophosphoesterase [Stellaceae bacterium]
MPAQWPGITSKEPDARAGADVAAWAGGDVAAQLEQRFGRLPVRQRLGLEDDHEARCTDRRHGSSRRRWYRSPPIIRNSLKLTGLYWRGRKNAERIQIRHHEVHAGGLPTAFDGFTILQLSDLHIDMNKGAMRHLAALLPGLAYDLCVLTGDYRGKTYGPFAATLDGMADLRRKLAGPVYGVLGNHDSLRMVPALEEMGIRMLVNEAELLLRDGQRLHLAGVDDAHSYRLDNIEKAAAEIPEGEFSILLSHTPEIYRQAAHAGFDLLLSGHTHGGQICLPGAIPVTLDSALPRRMGAGSWRYGHMVGYTSVGVGSCIVAVRINCPPEITLHHLRTR